VSSFFEELKRRNVIRVGVAYTVAAWLLAQVMQLAAESFEAPAWVMKMLITVLVIGLPVALVFSWAYEITPEGLRREREVIKDRSITHETGKKLNVLTSALLVLAIGFMAVDRFVLEPRPGAPEKGSGSISQIEPDPGIVPGPGIGAADHSIAVLPFADMSPDKDQEYFTDGISEELLNLLAKIPELRVAARTSSFQFKGQAGDIAEIAKQLKVTNILEGSVRKAGDRVRITAQLIKADDGYHLWSETWDRTLDDVFAIQDEISAAVVDALKITLLGEAPHSTETNPDAYALYLQGTYLLNQRTREAWEKAEQVYNKALRIDPDYAAAWAGLSQVQSALAGYGHRDLDTGMTQARESVERALALDPALGSAWANLASLLSTYEWDYGASGEATQRALELEPNNSMVLRQAGNQAKFTGRLNEAIALYKRALDLDPINSFLYGDLVGALQASNRFKEAENYARDLLNLNEQVSSAHSNLSYILMEQGDLEGALLEAQRETDEVWRLYMLAQVHHRAGRAGEADATLAQFIESHQDAWAYQAGELYAFRGEADRAFEWLDRAVAQRDPGLAWTLTDPDFRSLHADPRWEPLLERVGLLDAWRTMPEEFK